MYVFRLWGFEIFTIGAKVKKKKKNCRKSHRNENGPKNYAKMARSWSTVLVDLKTQCQLKDRSSADLLRQNLFVFGSEKFPKTAGQKKIHLAAIFHLILNINIR